MRTMTVCGEEWVQSADGQRYIRKEKTMTQSKAEWMAERFKKVFPSRYTRYEGEWMKTILPETPEPPSVVKINWTKPLEPAGNAKLRKIEFVEDAFVLNQTVHVCKIQYDSNDYTYYVMYDDYGRSLGYNAGTINVKNKVTEWGKSAWMVLDENGTMLSSRWNTRQEARKWAYTAFGGVKMDKFQYIRYDYVERL